MDDTISAGYDTVVGCKKCGRKQHLNFIWGLVNGWSKCCGGHTMPILKTTVDIKQVMNDFFKGNY